MSTSSIISDGFKDTILGNHYLQIFFIMTLVAIYALPEWKKAAGLLIVCAMGYTAMMMIMSLKSFSITAAGIKWIVPGAILILGLGNFMYKKNMFNNRPPSQRFRYFLAIIFGVLLGILFFQIKRPELISVSSLFKPMAMYAFGILLGHALIIALYLIISSVMITFLRVKEREWLLVITGVTFGIAVFCILHY